MRAYVFCIAIKLHTALYPAASTGSRFRSPVSLATTIYKINVDRIVKQNKSILKFGRFLQDLTSMLCKWMKRKPDLPV